MTTNLIIKTLLWSNQNNSIIRGNKRDSLKRIIKELRKWCKVETIDEYNTYKKCNTILSDTEKY